ncbi:MAG TPA: penicillin-binding protein 2 [Thermoleophilaceae bacterium]
MYRDTDHRPAITPQLALRVAILGGFALVMFGVIFFRLWYLQILSGDKYLADANNNRVREIRVDAPRGKIVDRNGNVLVDNRPGRAIVVRPDKLPPDRKSREMLYKRLSPVVGQPWREIRKNVATQLKAVPFSRAIVKQDATQAQFSYVLEHQEQLAGVDVERIFLRRYPHRSIGAHLFGTVGEVTSQELKDKQRYRGVVQGDRVGQSGIEYSYDRYLRGQDGADRVQVDSTGTLRGTLAERNPVQGHQLRLSLDFNTQRIGQAALNGRRGAFVVMDIKTGEVRALGSSPSFDPNIFAKVIKKKDYDALTSAANGSPLSNRAIQGLYPTGSTFKLITSVAALQSGVITPDTPQYDPGFFKLGPTTFYNAGKTGHGTLALRDAIKVSSDVFFYKLGAELNNVGNGHVLQSWARKLGLGHSTGIDLPAEQSGLVPSPEWRDRLFKKKLTDRPWSAGDNVNLAVGQGDLQADPLQMAVAYASIANGGYIVRPHLGMRIEDSEGRAIQEFGTPTRRRVSVRPEFRQAILDGLFMAANQPGGTSADVFKDFPIKVAGKTGTAEKGLGRPDQSWYIGLAPYPNPRYVVAVTDEQGGFGAETAAPDARRILAALFGIRSQENKVVKGASRTR